MVIPTSTFADSFHVGWSGGLSEAASASSDEKLKPPLSLTMERKCGIPGTCTSCEKNYKTILKKIVTELCVCVGRM
jgi:hypothetical protein